MADTPSSMVPYALLFFHRAIFYGSPQDLPRPCAALPRCRHRRPRPGRSFLLAVISRFWEVDRSTGGGEISSGSPADSRPGYQWNGCGYCGSRATRDDTSPSYYAQSEHMSPEHYQTLADRGWRRSGRTYYKPDLRNSCCPHYSIKLKADDFRPSSSQRKAVNAFNKHVIGVEYTRKAAGLCPRSRQEKRSRKQVFDVRQRIHEAEYDVLKRPIDRKNDEKPIEPAHRLTVTLESDAFTPEKYALFENYQTNVHKEPPSKVSRKSFTSFLCSGLPRTSDASGRKLGSYHQCYRLDGILVAFGVLDLLPHAVSSVYVVYRDDFAHWQFGKLSALREIALTLEGGYGWYYMGYYIHSCPKMRYKAEYMPQYVLDVSTLLWKPLDQTFWNALAHSKFVTYDDLEKTWRCRESSGIDDYGDDLPETIWDAKFEGVPPLEEIVDKVPLSELPCKALNLTLDLEKLLGEWDVTKIRQGRSMQTIVAELVACLGIDFIHNILIDVGPYMR